MTPNEEFIKHNLQYTENLKWWKEDRRNWGAIFVKCVNCGHFVTYDNLKFYNWDLEKVRDFSCQKLNK